MRFSRVEISLRKPILPKTESVLVDEVLLVKMAFGLLLIAVLPVSCAVLASGQVMSRANDLSKSTPDVSDVRIVSSFVAAGEPIPDECREEAHTFAQSLVRYPRPESWHWILICDEAGWRRYLRLSGRSEGDAIYASTDLDGKTTYIRGAKLLYPYDLNANPDGIMAHELAHIRLQTESESRAYDLAQMWQRKTKLGLR